MENMAYNAPFQRMNRQIACFVGDLVEKLWGELEKLPISDPAKKILVSMIIAEITVIKGNTVTFKQSPLFS